MSDQNAFELRLKNIKNSPYHAPVIDVMDTFETVVLGLKSFKVHFHACDAVALTQMILQRAEKQAASPDQQQPLI